MDITQVDRIDSICDTIIMSTEEIDELVTEIKQAEQLARIDAYVERLLDLSKEII